MRRFKYNEPHGNYDAIDTVNEYWIEKMYFPRWKEQCKRAQELGSPNVPVDFDFSLEKCIEDFCIVQWAWEI